MEQNKKMTAYCVVVTDVNAYRELYIQNTYEAAIKKKQAIENNKLYNVVIEEVELPIITGYIWAVQLSKITSWICLIISCLFGLFKYYTEGMIFLIPTIIFSIIAIKIIGRHKRIIKMIAYKQIEDKKNDNEQQQTENQLEKDKSTNYDADYFKGSQCLK